MRSDLLLYTAFLSRYSGLNMLCRPLYGGLGLILMFHRFTDDPEGRVNTCDVVGGLFLDRLLAYIRVNGPEIIPLSEAPIAIAERRKFICLTMDDGYRDNLRVALPILERYEAPATIFVPSGILDLSLDAWWLQLEELAKAQARPPAAYAAMLAQVARDKAALERLRPLFPARQEDLNREYFMNADEIRRMDQHPLIEIGGHTVSHPMLACLPEEEAYREILQNKKDLEQLLGRRVGAFAYPFGHAAACGVREFEMARRAGYKVAVTTRPGNVMGAHYNHLMSLPRYNVRGDVQDLAMYGMFRNGSYRALKSRLKSPVVIE